MDARITDLAATQHALVTRAQLRDLGLSDAEIDGLVKRRRLERYHEAVYAVPGAPRTWHQQLRAACLALGPGSAVSHRAAAALWGFDGPFGGRVEVACERSDKSRPKGVVIHRSTDINPRHVTERFGVPVTTPARTLLDLGAVVPQSVLNRALDDALARQRVEYDELLVVLDKLARRGRRGVGKLRRSLAERTGVPESVLEAEFQRLVARFELPEPVYQWELYDENGKFVGRIDVAYPDLLIGVELDGASTRVGRGALNYDTDRQNRILDCGVSLRRYTWKAVVGTPEKTAAELHRLIARRRCEFGLPAVA